MSEVVEMVKKKNAIAAAATTKKSNENFSVVPKFIKF